MQLACVRHAHAAPAANPDQDQERPLDELGHRQAQGVVLPWHPDVVLTSPARRTKETAKHVLNRLNREGRERLPMIEVPALSLHKWDVSDTEWEAVFRFVFYGDGSGEYPLREILAHYGPETDEYAAMQRISEAAWSDVLERCASSNNVLIVGHAVFLPAMLHFAGHEIGSSFVFTEAAMLTLDNA